MFGFGLRELKRNRSESKHDLSDSIVQWHSLSYAVTLAKTLLLAFIRFQKYCYYICS